VSAGAPRAPGRGRRLPLVGLAILFGGPLVLAVALYFSGRADFGTLPNPDRELIAGAIRIPDEPLETPDGGLTAPEWARYRWSLIYAKIGPCETVCQEHLTRLTQVYLALGGDRDRTQRVLLATDSVPEPVRDGTLVVGLLDRGAGVALADLLGRDRIGPGRFIIVDPLGLVVVSYPPDADQSRLLKDLERLLDVSRVG